MLPLRALYAGLPPAKSQTNRVRDAFCKDDGRSPPDTRAACRAAACSMAWSSALELCAGAEGRSWSRAVALEAEAVMAGSEAARSDRRCGSCELVLLRSAVLVYMGNLCARTMKLSRASLTFDPKLSIQSNVLEAL
mmetsp:Transcript_27071/g.64586  ORF Transcript_27071/g.64586 Transcript_27071/m.64586 type:complete len:136 (-) Transcript_27071:75-482(-)